MMKQNAQQFLSALAALAMIFSTALTFSSSAFASGGGGGGGGFGGGGGGFGGSSAPQARPIDQNYETGKAIYRGRVEGIPKIAYCVKGESDELVPLKGKSVKPFKRSTYNEFANALYNCEAPETRIASELKRDDFLFVIYYLNKRHKLNLN